MGWIAFLIVAVVAYFVCKDFFADAKPSANATARPRTAEEFAERNRHLDDEYHEEERRERAEERRMDREDARQEKQEMEQEKREQWGELLTDFLGRMPTKKEDACLRKSFGGWDECLYNFSMYEARVRNGSTACHVPPRDHYRPRFETLAATGAVLRGDAVQPIDLLWCLGMDQLRTLADACGAKRAQSKDELRRRVKAQGAEAVAAAWPALGIPESDIFLLDPARIRELCA